MMPLPTMAEDLCDDMRCPEIFRAPDCDGGDRCPMLHRILRGISIYMLAGDEARFVGVVDKRKH